MEAYINDVAVEILRGHVQTILTKKSLPKFWPELSGKHESVDASITNVYNALLSLMADVSKQSVMEEVTNYYPVHLVTRIDQAWDQEKIYEEVVNVVLSSIPDTVFSSLKYLIAETLKDCDTIENSSSEADMETECSVSCTLKKFTSFLQLLQSGHLLTKFIINPLTSVMEDKISELVEEECSKVFDELILEKLKCQVNSMFMGWLRIIFHEISQDELSVWRQKILNQLYYSFGKMRIEEFFDIIVEFPESLPAVQDLKKCLVHTNLWNTLKTSLKDQFSRRLLHPGANTADILTHYISSIKVLHILDATGVLLENVCASVQAYLRTREDTVFCIMASLTDEGGNELSEELASGRSQLLDLTEEYDDENEDFLSWNPDPIEADPTKTSKSRQTQDIVSILVNIYGSQEMFVNEYRHLLSDRILQSLSYDTSHEFRNLELLKLRFGEANLYFCDVMLKDIADSRRCNAHIHAQLDKNSNDSLIIELEFNCFIISRVFWPNLKREVLEPPEAMKLVLDSYTKHFQSLKGMRTLEWYLNLGLMEVELELDGRTNVFHVSPPKAIIIWHFQEKNIWCVNELSEVTQSQASVIRKHLSYWVCQGILLEESPDVFTLTSSFDLVDIEVNDDTNEDDAIGGSKPEQNENDEMLWSYISAMLTNLGAMPVERIQTMLKMFMTDMKEYSDSEIKSFLDKRVKNQELVCSGGCYQLP